MCKCGHTPEQHEVSGLGLGTSTSVLSSLSYNNTIYMSHCKEPECSCEIYRLAEAIPVVIEGTRKRR